MPYSPAAGIVIDQRARYERLWGALTKRQAALAASAMADIEADLKKARRGSWTSAMAAATLAQLGEATRGLSESQLRLLSRALPGIAGIAKDDLADYLGKLDEHYLGVARPLRWDALEWLEGYSRPLLRSRLRIYEKSFARYGAESVEGIESAMAKSVLLGTPWTEARESVMGLVREQVGGRQWMVDRIVRTECATVYASTTMAALLEEDEPDDPMLKKLVALWDKVTGLDSKLLHGQTRRVQDLFTDVVRGKEFDAPPNRPNDREIVIGWRSSWGPDAGFDADTRNADGSDNRADGADVDVDAAIRDGIAAHGPRDPMTESADNRLAVAHESLARLKADEPTSKSSSAWFDWDDRKVEAQVEVRAAARSRRMILLDEQSARAGGSDLPMSTRDEAVRALVERGMDPTNLPTGADADGWIRLMELELRSLDRLEWAPQISGFATTSEHGEDASVAGWLRSEWRDWPRTEPEDLRVTLGITPALVKEGAQRERALRQGIMAPWNALMPRAEIEKMRRAYEAVGMDLDAGANFSMLIRHEFSHGIESTIQYSRDRRVSDAYYGWKRARDRVTADTPRGLVIKAKTGSWHTVSVYASTDDQEMFAESFALAMSGGWDKIPTILHGPMKTILKLYGSD
jgi:hypothetical protein